MFRRTSSCPHFTTTSPPPTPPPPPRTGEDDKGADRATVAPLSPPAAPTHPPARPHATQPPAGHRIRPSPPLPRRGWIRPGVGGCSWRRRAAARSSPEGNAAFFAGFDPGNSPPFKSPSTGLD
ncbi:hypothetical protein ZWY2020_046980 [Hordeum vulgare]|nr:hypothetical protein ZWY2020_046980 [Hordeum vulgare]